MQCVGPILLSQVCRSTVLEQESSFKHLNLTYSTTFPSPVAQKGAQCHTLSAGHPQSLQQGLSCQWESEGFEKWRVTNTAIFPQTVTNFISISPNGKPGFTFLSASWKKGPRGEHGRLHELPCPDTCAQPGFWNIC